MTFTKGFTGVVMVHAFLGNSKLTISVLKQFTKRISINGENFLSS